jgi:hypothetical protein
MFSQKGFKNLKRNGNRKSLEMGGRLNACSMFYIPQSTKMYLSTACKYLTSMDNIKS